MTLSNRAGSIGAFLPFFVPRLLRFEKGGGGAMGFLSAIFGASRMNADPDQQRLARMLIEAVEQGKNGEFLNWFVRQPWSPSETRTRLAHAVSITKISSIPETYQSVKSLAGELHKASYRLG